MRSFLARSDALLEPYDALWLSEDGPVPQSGGDDTVDVTATTAGFGTLDGGAGTDTLRLNPASPQTNANGPFGPYSLSIGVFNNPATTTVISFERFVFNSTANNIMSAQLAYGGNNGAANQIGSGLAANSEIVGGAGSDTLTLIYNSANLPGTVTAPNFTLTNWTTPTRAYLAGDRISISVSGNGATMIDGTAHTGIQGLNGGGGDDIINGSNDMDSLSGGAGGNDQLYGNGGDDILSLVNTFLYNNGSAGPQTTRTGAGSLFDGGSGTDFLVLGGYTNFLGTVQNIEGLFLQPGFINYNNSGQPILLGSQYSPDITFSSATFAAFPTNLIVAGQGNVSIRMGNGGEAFNAAGIVFEPGADIFFSFSGGSGADQLTGTEMADGFEANGGNDTIFALGGDDTIDGGDGDDVLYGGTGNDIFIGGNGNDFLYGGDGDDILYGIIGIDKLYGDAGNDRLVIGASANFSSIDGGAGFDTLIVTAGVTFLNSLTGVEAIELQNGSTLTLTGTQFKAGLAASTTLSGSGTLAINMAATDLELYLQQFVLAGGAGITITVNGSSSDEIIKGVLQAANTINGGGGSDQIRGGALADTINGGDGDDKLMGANGADILTGGLGADTFRFQAASQSGVGSAADTITDFTIGTDKLAFAAIDTDLVTPGDQAFAFIGNAAFGASGAAQMRYMTSGANLLVQADINGDGIADMEVVLAGLAGQTLTSGDFLL